MTNPYSDTRSGALSSIVTSEVFPDDQRVSEHTLTARGIGAATMLDILMCGDLSMVNKDAFGEVISRVLENARAQEINL